MFKNYLFVIVRNIKRNLFFSIINILGLAIGLACCMFIFFFVKGELSFDQFHSKSDRIFRVINEFKRPAGTLKSSMTPPTVSSILRTNFPEIEKVTRMRYSGGEFFSVENRIFTEDNVFYADSVFLQLFDFPMLAGDRSALNQPNSIVISRNAAIKYFGSLDVIGKTMEMDNSQILKVTGVTENTSNSHLNFDMLVSFSSFKVPEGYPYDLTSWRWVGFLTFALLKEHAKASELESKVTNHYQGKFGENSNIEPSAFLQPLADIYLGSNDMRVPGSIRLGNRTTINILSIAAGLILLIAGFNFMNLSTAMSLIRSKEIGIRKVMGAQKKKVIVQFLFESVIIGLISLLFAFILVLVGMPFFREWFDVTMPVDISSLVSFLPLFVLVTLIIGLLAGLYPSMMLSSHSAISALRGMKNPVAGGSIIRKILMTLQFSISVTLIFGSVIVTQQMEYIRTKTLGFDSQNIFQIEVGMDVMAQYYDALKNTFKQNPQVIDVAQVSGNLHGSLNSAPVRLKEAPESSTDQMAYLHTDYAFLEIMDIDLVQGRFFKKEFPTDSAQAVLLNETAVKKLGLKDPIGKDILYNNQERTIIGVFSDFHYNSLHEPISPVIIAMPYIRPQYIYLKLQNGNIQETTQSIENDWYSVVGNIPFNATFMEEGLSEMYKKEEKLSFLITIFSTLAILLACLGLYGLVAFSINNKLREVSIRKVLGASINGLLILLSKQFVLLVIIAILFALPITWYFADEWLNSFAYRVDIGARTFMLSSFLLLTIVLLTISYQTIKAALTNPVKVLRSE